MPEYVNNLLKGFGSVVAWFMYRGVLLVKEKAILLVNALACPHFIVDAKINNAIFLNFRNDAAMFQFKSGSKYDAFESQ